MKFLSGQSSLDSISGGVLTAGRVPLTRMRGVENSSQNPGLTVVTNVLGIIDTGVSHTPVLGDRFLVVGNIRMTKAGTLGDTHFEFDFTGTGTAEFFGTNTHLDLDWPNHPANKLQSGIYVGFGECTVVGTLIPRLQGSSGGSNGNIAAGNSSFRVLWLRNS